MILSIIAAMDRNHLIGNNNRLPWHLPADFAHFKAVTIGKPVLMGRKTFESIGKPLPGRFNIVLSRNPDCQFAGAECVASLEEALALVPDALEIMIIGGSAVYEMLLPQVDRMYLTYVDATFDGDAWFPEFAQSEWLQTANVKRQKDEKNPYDCNFVTLQRKN